MNKIDEALIERMTLAINAIHVTAGRHSPEDEARAALREERPA